MCRNISNILFVLFAVVLGLAASEGGVSANNPLACYRAVEPVGEILCELYGYGKYESGGLNYGTCELKCGEKSVPLPKEACPSGHMNSGCTKKLAETLAEWSKDMTKRKDDLIGKWCTNALQG
uniref:Putative secreted protein n=1 Tax=Ixodes ricinus TaxID=34613 RepID=V5GMU1_IXORI